MSNIVVKWLKLKTGSLPLKYLFWICIQETISGARPHILVLNKEDLIPAKSRAEIIDKIKEKKNIKLFCLTNIYVSEAYKKFRKTF